MTEESLFTLQLPDSLSKGYLAEGKNTYLARIGVLQPHAINLKLIL
ncbi:MAG: hypothetical protein WC832_09175 [Anaerolineales bacterium]